MNAVRFLPHLVTLIALLTLAACSTQRPAPEVELEMLDGSQQSLSEFTDGPVLLTFWATTCPGCIEEIPLLETLQKDYGDQGLTVLGVAMSYDPRKQVEELVERRNLGYPIALDSDGRVAQAFGDVRLTPTSFLISPEGKIVYQKIGVIEMENVRGRIEAML